MYQQLLITRPQLDDNWPKADGSTLCKQSHPVFSASILCRRETEEQRPIHQNENSATTCYYPLFTQTSDHKITKLTKLHYRIII